MRPSVRLGTFAGIRVGLHWSVAFVAALFTFSLAGSILPNAAPGYTTTAYYMVALSTAALFFASITAHEFGHSIVARRNGVGIEGITLFALGGVAVMDREPDRPGPAFRIAVAGPLVSVAVGLLSLGAAFAMAAVGFADLSVTGMVWLGLINLALAGFNMLPALPLDGGRVLQAALWKRRGDQLRATATAASVGRVIGNLLMLLGVYLFLTGSEGLWTAFIGWFISSSARAEEFRARRAILAREATRDERVANPPGDVIDV